MSLNDKATAALTRELAKCFPERAANDPGHAKLAAALSDTARHTPGPWVFEDYLIQSTADGVYGGEKWVAQVLRMHCPEGPANAHLLAAAPELLEACKAMVAAWDCPTSASVRMRGEAINDIRAAIARATGGAA